VKPSRLFMRHCDAPGPTVLTRLRVVREKVALFHGSQRLTDWLPPLRDTRVSAAAISEISIVFLFVS
jgi:hypothetical protein